MSVLQEYGWTARFMENFATIVDPGLQPARVIEHQREAYVVISEHGSHPAAISGRLRNAADCAENQPAVGDWVAVEIASSGTATTIVHVLDRQSKISRKVAGKSSREQVIAANLDTVFLVSSCNEDLNSRRIERYLTMIWDSGARPVVLLNKVDLVDTSAEFAGRVELLAPDVPVHLVSALAENGLEALDPYREPSTTIALLGSSGVGKSTIVNRLMCADVQTVGPIREDDARGRHTTSHRQLFRLPCGTLLIDTPGLREVGLWRADAGLDQTFPEIQRLSIDCKYANCTHESEPDCAVLNALAGGDLPADRLESYRNLRKEMAHLERKLDSEAQANVKRRWKTIHKSLRHSRKKGWIR